MEFVEQILTSSEEVVAAVPPTQKKHLLHILVKKVLIRDRNTAEIWYRGSPWNLRLVHCPNW